ncbi:MAG TPA: hypothetical protein VFH31_12510 [Pyrinomonadaceae bacterium]|nr:hypothetical protein [Pyrinomonadaceae bacterium]
MDSKSFDTLKAYSRLADQFVEHATKEQLGDCARILALNVAHYARRYGELPLEERLDLLHAMNLSEEQAKLVEQGLENSRPGCSGT